MTSGRKGYVGSVVATVVTFSLQVAQVVQMVFVVELLKQIHLTRSPAVCRRADTAVVIGDRQILACPLVAGVVAMAITVIQRPE